MPAERTRSRRSWDRSRTATSTGCTTTASDGSVLVALSGGVDSAVALLRLVGEGRHVEAAMVKLWPGDDPRSCCGPDALARARAVADACGVILHVLDEEARFARTVVEPFVAAYLSGETPNPCVRCNPERLAALVRLADERGLAHVATGHYARRISRDREVREVEVFLARGRDRAKDQSYMLAAVPSDVLGRLDFPLGEMTKPEVRAAAREAGLRAAGQPESQEVCFALDGYRRFLSERGVPPRPGPVVDRRGRVLGGHDGHWLFTIGQRRGLGISASEPLYVVERRADANEVVVGGACELAASEVIVRDVVDRGIATASGRLSIQLRYRSKAVPVSALEPEPRRRGGRASRDAGASRTSRPTLEPGDLLVRLATPFSAAAPGQAAVFYADDVVVGAGVVGARGAVAL